MWSMALEQRGWQPEAVALAVTLRPSVETVAPLVGTLAADSSAANGARPDCRRLAAGAGYR